MSDLLVVARKEWSELFAERHSRRSIVVQSFFVVLVLGVINPLGAPAAWQEGSAAVAVIYLLFPGFSASAVAADAFAGEHERHTLETLLATPLSEWSILLGKTLAAIGFALLVTMASVLTAAVVLALSLHTWAVPPFLMLRLLGAGSASALALTSVAVLVSLKVPVARSAQQMTAVAATLLAVAVAGVLRLAGTEASWRTLSVTELLLVVLAVAALATARALFGRERLLER